MIMQNHEPVNLKRDVEAALVPAGTKVTLQKGETAYITQTLGGSYTVVVNGNMFRVDGRDADALGIETAPKAATTGAPVTPEQMEKQVWDAMKTCYDPEIPVNIVDLGLIYDCHTTPLPEGGQRVEIKMTLTAPGCGMGEVLKRDVERKVLNVPGVSEVDVELVWEPF